MNAPAKIVTLALGEAHITIPAEAAAKAYLERLLEDMQPLPALEIRGAPLSSVPQIGADMEGGKFAGLTIADNVPMRLVLMPGDDELDWHKAMAKAEREGVLLPSRFDQLVLFKNLKAEFQSTWYWSSEPHAGDDAYAWYQNFGYGNQLYDPKGGTDRARFVRRLPI